MFALWMAELRRFRWLALGAVVLLTGALQFVDRLSDALLQPLAIYRLAAAICALLGLLLGLYQAMSYRRTSQWIALIHRPVAPRRILWALGAASGCALLLTTALPVVLMLGAHQVGSGSMPDTRHWLLPVAAWLFAMIGYVAGLYLVLAPRRYGWLAMLVAFLPAVSMAAGWHALLVQAGTMVVLAAMVTTVFKPDLDGPPRSSGGIAATAFTVAMGAWLVAAVVGDLAFQTVWIATGNDPLNGEVPRGGIVEASRADGQALMADALSLSPAPQARLWREQAVLSEVYRVDPLVADWPRRGALTNIGEIRFTDPDRRVDWTFSHDDMRFHGRAVATRRRGGVLGIGGDNAPFRQPPMVVDDGRMLTASGILAYDRESGRIDPLLMLPPGRVIASAPVLVGDAVAVMTSRDLRFHDARMLEDGDRLYPVQTAIPLPGPIGSLLWVDLIDLLDGYLAVFTYGRDINSPDATWQAVRRVDERGRVTAAGERRLTPDYPALSRFAGWWLSPALTTVRNAAVAWPSGNRPLGERRSDVPPPLIWILAAILSLLAMGAAIPLGRSRGMGWRQVVPWALVTLLTGPPMYVALWLIRPTPHS